MQSYGDALDFKNTTNARDGTGFIVNWFEKEIEGVHLSCLIFVDAFHLPSWHQQAGNLFLIHPALNSG
jgi:hypothetical protein